MTVSQLARVDILTIQHYCFVDDLCLQLRDSSGDRALFLFVDGGASSFLLSCIVVKFCFFFFRNLAVPPLFFTSQLVYLLPLSLVFRSAPRFSASVFLYSHLLCCEFSSVHFLLFSLSATLFFGKCSLPKLIKQ